MHKFIPLIICICAVLLSGCYGAEQRKIKQLEKDGKIPVLDRTDSLAGIDDNNNGIRDDIEDYINKNYQDEEIKEALFIFAKTTQNTLLIDSSNKEEARTVARSHLYSSSCLRQKMGSNDYYLASDQIISMTTNTKVRLLAYLNYNKALDGTAWQLPQGDACEYL